MSSGKRKGLSAEEKRIKMLEIFHESKDFYQLKELEKIAPKEKGIVAQSVKDVVQSLVDDSLVDTDKIGTSIYFWSFPSKVLNAKKRKLEDLNTRSEEIRKKLKFSQEKLSQEKAEKPESDERTQLLQQIEELGKKEIALREKLQEYQDNDPETLEKMKENTKLIAEAANRWTDNIYAIKSWCKRKFNIEETTLDKHFEIPSELEYIDT